MIAIKLPDGSVKEYPEGVRPRDVAEGIGKRLAEAAVAAVANGTIVDMDRPLEDGQGPIELRLLTNRDREALDVLRHSTAHVMARAIMRVFPGVKLAFGPTTANGFYYDVDLPDRPLSEDDFPAIEAEMAAVIKDAEPFERFSLPVPEARQFVGDLNQSYKVEHIDDELQKYGVLSFYRQGEFVDLCRGPHIPHAGKVGAFKLLSIAGAYWKGHTDRKMLQRVYGTAFFDKKELDAHMAQVEEAKKRDHRKLGKELGLFTISPMVGSGLILWMPKGAIVRGLLESFLKDELMKRGYQPVYTPHIGKIELYQTSGHYPYYKDSQFPPIRLLSDAAMAIVDGLEKETIDEAGQRKLLRDAGIPELIDPSSYLDETKMKLSGALTHENYWHLDKDGRIRYVQEYGVSEEYLLKPMNCPHHIQIYAAQPRSYRDLPVRLAEFGTVYRYEQSGELSGMTRVRGFTQDDAHLFCTVEQVRGEFRATMELTQFVLNSLGLTDYKLRLSRSDPDDPKYQGAQGETWQVAEADIRARARRDAATLRRGARGGGVLRSQGRLHRPRLHRPPLAVGDGPTGLRPPRAVRPHLQRRRQPDASPRDDPSRPVREHGAVHGHPDRALRRRLPALARAGAGPRPADLGQVPRLRPLRAGRTPGRGAAGLGRHASGEGQRQDPRRPTGEDPGDARGRRPRGGDRDRLLPRPD